MVRQRTDVERASSICLYGCCHALPEALVGYAHYRGTPHARRLEQHPFDLSWIDVGPAPKDQRVPAVTHEQPSHGIEVPDVARVEHAVSDRFGSRFRLSQVTE